MAEIRDIKKKPLFENLDKCLHDLSYIRGYNMWQGATGLIYLLFCHQYGLHNRLPNGILKWLLEDEKKECLSSNGELQHLADDLFNDLQSGQELFQDENAEPYRRFLINYSYLSDKFYCEVIDYIVNYVQTADRHGEYGSTPDMTEIFASIAKLMQVKSIFDPCAGACNLACSPLMKNVQFYGQEINHGVSNLARVRLLAHEIKATCVREDSCGHWPDDLNQFDALVSELPLGVYVSSEEAMRETGRPGRRMIEDIFMHRFLMSPIQKCIMLLPMSFCYRRENYDIRQELVEKRNVQAIIALPAGAIRNTAIPTCLVVINKLIRRHSIRFIDASDCMMKNAKGAGKLDVPTIIDRFLEYENDHTRIVPTEELFNNDCILSPTFYTNQTGYPEGFKVVELGDLVEFVNGEKRFDDNKGHLVRISNLSPDAADCVRTIECFEVTEELSNAKKITEPVILLSSIRDLKPTYCEASVEHPIFILPGIIACRVTKGWVSPTYLCLELSRRGSLFVGIFSHISRATLMKIKVAFPSIDQQRSLEEQNNLYKEASEGLKLAKVKEMGLQNTIDRLAKKNEEQLHSRKHSLKQNTSSLGTNWADLVDYLMSNGGKFDEEDTIGILNPTTIGEIITSITENIKIIERKIEHLTDADIDYGRAEDIDLQRFILDYIDKNKSARFFYSFKEKGKLKLDGYDAQGEVVRYLANTDWVVVIPKAALHQVFDNIVSNARSHGFEDRQESSNCIKFDFYYTSDSIVLEISNNGIPLKEGVDTEYIKTSGCSTKMNERDDKGEVHTGDGGADMDAILKKYNATMEVESTPDALFTVTYKIVFSSIKKTPLTLKIQNEL